MKGSTSLLVLAAAVLALALVLEWSSTATSTESGLPGNAEHVDPSLMDQLGRSADRLARTKALDDGAATIGSGTDSRGIDGIDAARREPGNASNPTGVAAWDDKLLTQTAAGYLELYSPGVRLPEPLNPDQLRDVREMFSSYWAVREPLVAARTKILSDETQRRFDARERVDTYDAAGKVPPKGDDFIAVRLTRQGDRKLYRVVRVKLGEFPTADQMREDILALDRALGEQLGSMFRPFVPTTRSK